MAGSQQTALITGISGQDGYYLSQLLLEKGYRVHGIDREPGAWSSEKLQRLHPNQFAENISYRLHFGDMLDPIGLRRIISECKPDEVYNLAGQSHVGTSFERPIYTANVVAMGTLNLLEAVRDYRDTTGHEVRFYQASSSEMFGKPAEAPQNERTPFHPTSPYACAKLHAYWQTVTYREAYSLHASNGILYNHESPRRTEAYVTRKITRAAARIKLGLQEHLYLGNLDARRDWGFAGDYVEVMWLMLQQAEPDDYVIATGVTHSVRDFLAAAFGSLDLDWHDYVRVDENYFRPLEPGLLQGDAAKAREVLGWQPGVGFDELVGMMVASDVELAERERTLADAGYAM